MRISRLAALALTACFAACAGTPAPGDSGYPFNVEGPYSGTLSADGQGFRATMNVVTDQGGVVSGTFAVTDPVALSGTLSGMLVGDQLTLSMRYGNNPLSGCSGGSVSGNLTVADGGTELGGTVTIDDCGTILEGRTRFTRGN